MDRVAAHKAAGYEGENASTHALENNPLIRQAIAHGMEVALRGSLMTTAQRRDYVLDRLIVESLDLKGAVRMRAIEMLGKTVPDLFHADQPNQIKDISAIEQRITDIINAAKSRDITGESTRCDDAQHVNSDSLNAEVPAQPEPPQPLGDV